MSDQVAKRAKMEGESVNEVQRKSTSPKKIICDFTAQKISEIVDYETFVDKTLFIKAFLEAGQRVIVALAPRRFGKSTNMDTVKEFVTGNKKLFQDNRLKIYTEERDFFDEHCQKNPVIHVDFKRIRGITNKGILRDLQKLIFYAFNGHSYLIKVTEGRYAWSDTKLEAMGTIEEFKKYWMASENLSREDVIDGLRVLSHCLHVYHEKPVYVFIDEYDSPIMENIINTSSGEEVLDETIRVIRGITSNLLKANEHIKKGLINACVRIAEVTSADANNITYYEFLRKATFSPYFGFTDKEVESLFERDEFAHLNDERVKEWYNGYTLLHTTEYVIYSCYSVLQYLENSKEISEPCFERYWVDSGYIPKLKELFAKTEIRTLIEDLIAGEEVEIMTIKKYTKEDIFTLQRLIHQKLDVVRTGHAHLFLQFLTENGYLNVTSTGDRTNTIRAPNNEIKELLKEKCYCADLLAEKYHLHPQNISNYVQKLQSLLQQRDNNAFIGFAKAVSKLFHGAVMPECEDEFHSILFTLAYNFKHFKVRSELSVQQIRRLGRPPHLDILVIWGEIGMILEKEWEDKSSEEAHSQIITQEYETAFVNYKDVKEKILLGVHMTKERKVSLTYTVNKSSKQTVTSDD